VSEQIFIAESNGDPNAKNKRSSATGSVSFWMSGVHYGGRRCNWPHQYLCFLLGGGIGDAVRHRLD
jgi:hypothetical protein